MIVCTRRRLGQKLKRPPIVGATLLLLK